MRQEQRLVKRIVHADSLRFLTSRKDRIRHVNRSLAFMKLTVARARRSLREKARFNRRNKHRIIFVEEPAELVGTFHIRSGEEGYSCTLVDPPAPTTLKSEEVEVNIGPVSLIENFSGPVEPHSGIVNYVTTTKPALTENDIQNWLSAGGIY